MRTPAPGLVLAALVAAGLTTAAALSLPHGLPYDEPVHWQNVRFYAEHGRFPRIGEPGSSYESQMGPVYYVLAAALLRLTGATGDGGLLAVRLIGVPVAVAVVVVTWLLARRCGQPRSAAGWAACLVATSPLLMTVGGSVQNDQITVLLAGVTLLAALPLVQGAQTSVCRCLLVGGLAGLTTLTKLPGVALLPAVVLAVLLARPGRRPPCERWRAALLLGLSAVVVSGWWFVRNVLVHGDLTGARAVETTGVDFPPLRLSGLRTLVGQLASYPFAPTEYTRNVVDAPRVVELTAVALTLLCVGVLGAGLLSVLRSREGADPRVLLLGGAVALTVLGYVVHVVAIWATPPRLLVQCAPALAVAAVAAAGRLRLRGAVPVVVAAQLACACWLLVATAGATPPG